MLMQGKCENCGRDAHWSSIDGQTYRCSACGSWSFLGAVEQSPEQLYGAEYFNGGEYAGYREGEVAFARNFTHLADLVEKHARSLAGTRLVELGCATGLFLQEASKRGVRAALGIETSGYCRTIAGERGLDVVAPGPNALEGVKALQPEVLVAWDVWEHLRQPSQQIGELLDHCARDVTIAMTTVDAGSLVAVIRGTRWRQYHPPTHLHYPTRRGLATFLEDRGFAIQSHTSVGYFRPFLAYLQAIGMRRTQWLQRLQKLPVYLNLWDIQLVIATRRSSEAEHG